MYFTGKDRVKQKTVKKTITPADIILKNYRNAQAIWCTISKELERRKLNEKYNELH